MSPKIRPITRRTVLRGAGAAVGLPLLEAMRPAMDALAAADRGGATDGRPPVRMACLFWPNGCNPHTWTPKGRGKDFEFSPILKPLARHKDDVLILTHLSNRGTFTGDGHYVKDAAWLTGTTIRRTTGSDLHAGGVSMDQLAARRIGVLTPMPSLELGVEPVTTGVDTNVGYTRLYGSHISWSSPTTPVAREINPRLAFDRLFRSGAGKGAGGDDDRSILDLVGDDARASIPSAPSRRGSPSRPATAAPDTSTTPGRAGTSRPSAAGSTSITATPAASASGRWITRSTSA
jgi:hypothetical protein